MRLQGKRFIFVLTSLFLMSTVSFAEKYSINGIFTIEVGDEFELQNSENVKKTASGGLTVLNGNTIVFQQYGLNADFDWAFNSYARIIIFTGSGEEEGTYPASNQGVELTESERSELITFAREAAKPYRIVQGPRLSDARINGYPCIKVFYEREGDYGGARATSFWFFNDTQFAQILASYAIPDEAIYMQPLAAVIESFTWIKPRVEFASAVSSDEDAEETDTKNDNGPDGLVLISVILVLVILAVIALTNRKE